MLSISELEITQGITTSPVIIENDIWVGKGIAILSGIKVGKGSTVAAGIMVTKNVKPYTLVVGIPEKTIKILEDST